MSDYYELFLRNMGPESCRREVPISSIHKYRGHLPDLLMTHWKIHGWSSYGNGIFWTVNPAEYSDVVRHWLNESGIADFDSYHAVARSAFGDLYLWQSQTGRELKISANHARYSIDKQTISSKEQEDIAVKAFFITLERTTDDFDGLFNDALKKLGPLQPDEMYGFVPAIALGGPGNLRTLEKVKTIEHLTFLSQLSPLSDWGFPDLDTL